MARISFFTFFILICFRVYTQPDNTVISGYVLNTTGTPLSLVNIGIKDQPYGTFSKDDGWYLLSFPADNNDHVLVFSRIGYKNFEVPFTASADTFEINVSLKPRITRLQDVNIMGYRQEESASLKNLPLKHTQLIPSAAGNMENLLVSMPGVNSTNELSNQYTVRGGNYDENLVYVNDIEIYHPVLIKSGQQEGLSFMNPDLISNVRFSAGGFNASYGNRMSSVLDIRYKDPSETKGSIKSGLLLNTAHIEGTGVNTRLSYLAGARYKTNQLLLQTLDTKGNYKPSFYDFQSLLKYRLSRKAEISLMASYNSNTYSFIPESRRSSFGNYNEAYQLLVLYDGSETDNYRSLNLALSLDLESREGLTNKFIAHYYNSAEKETFDIRGSYSLNLLDKNLGSGNLGDSIMNVGIGSWLNHARNILIYNIYTFKYKGRWEYSNNIFSWGMKYNFESGKDRIREWKKIDSAGYSIPYSSDELMLSKVLINDTLVSSNRFEGYFINSYKFNILGQSFIFTGGIRFSYWSFSEELLFSPRLSLSWTHSSNKARCYISGGVYYQPPFYREMRFPAGGINTDIKSQKSVHTVAGVDYNFLLGTTPFRLTGELYYKNLKNIIPYKYDNVRIIYSAENSARGFVRGLDLRLNGEFVKDAESWISISLMDARHDILNDKYGYFPAPSDTRFSLNIFFQDYFPTNPTYRAHLNLHYSTGIPVSSPYNNRYDSYRRMPAYKRVDIGFTKVFKNEYSSTKEGFLSFFDEIIGGFEILNLLDIRNTISYNWLTTVNNLSGETRQYAVPNYLTGRSYNLRLLLSF
ncbi:MAG: carboxypeptidase-like regulatory domain-containing protein [Bacteroidota bacterium]|nr:carboxypeptidase-like regulatory domain-containing protein [Bacteroidota bacterium]